MTNLEKRQMMLMGRYQKQGIYRFVMVKGTLTGLMCAVIGFLNSVTLFNMPWYFDLLSWLIIGWLFGIGMWFFVMWYFAKIKNYIHETEGVTQQ